MEYYEDLCAEFCGKYPDRKCDPDMVKDCVRMLIGIDVVRLRQFDGYLDYVLQYVDSRNNVGLEVSVDASVDFEVSVDASVDFEVSLDTVVDTGADASVEPEVRVDTGADASVDFEVCEDNCAESVEITTLQTEEQPVIVTKVHRKRAIRRS
jgi:hypothetical protein